MGFTTEGITNVRSQPVLLGRTSQAEDVIDVGFAEVTWQSAHTTKFHQVYVNGYLAAVTETPATSLARVSVAPGGMNFIEVIAVDVEDRWTDFSASLTGFSDQLGARVKVEWSGGTYLDPAIDHFEVFGNSGEGEIDFQNPLSALPIPAFPAGLNLSGFGRGGFGRGGFGKSATRYVWTSEKLTAATYKFAVLGIDAAGNRLETTLQSIEVEVTPPPRPPTDFRIFSYDAGDKKALLAWTASPDV